MAIDPNYASLCDLPKGGAVGKLMKNWALAENKSRAALANRINGAPMLKGIEAMPEGGEPDKIRGHLLMDSNIASIMQTFAFATPKKATNAEGRLRKALAADEAAWSKQLLNVTRTTDDPMELALAVMLQQAYKNPADKNFYSLNNMLNHFFEMREIQGAPGAYRVRSMRTLNGGVAGEELCAPLLALIDDEQAKAHAQMILTQPQAVGHVAGVVASRKKNTGHGGPG